MGKKSKKISEAMDTTECCDPDAIDSSKPCEENVEQTQAKLATKRSAAETTALQEPKKKKHKTHKAEKKTDKAEEKTLKADKQTHETEEATKLSLQSVYKLCPGLEYQLVSETGPSHKRVFTMQAQHNGQVFEAEGTSKHQAKANVAEKLLAYLNQQTPSDSLAQVPPSSLKKKSNGSSSPSSESEQIPYCWKCPCYVLNIIQPGTKYEVVCANDDSSDKTFKMSVVFDGKVFHGSGHSKKAAKDEAAQAAIESCLNDDKKWCEKMTEAKQTTTKTAAKLFAYLRQQHASDPSTPNLPSPQIKAKAAPEEELQALNSSESKKKNSSQSKKKKKAKATPEK